MAPVYTRDNGADSYLNQGMRLLAEWYPWLLSTRQYNATLPLNGMVVNIPRLRKAERVWLDDGTTDVPLLQRDQRQIQAYYGVPLSALAAGTPANWCEVVKGSQGALEGTAGRDLLVAPPSDKAYTIHVQGFFYLADLVSNTDTNELLERYHDAVIHAAWACYLRAQGNLKGFQAEVEAIRNVDLRDAAIDYAQQCAEEWEDENGLVEMGG